MVFYFTATGNCLYVARELAGAEGEGAEPVSIPQEMAREGELSYADDAIGIGFLTTLSEMGIEGEGTDEMLRKVADSTTIISPCPKVLDADEIYEIL